MPKNQVKKPVPLGPIVVKSMKKKKILVLCTGNSCRSQMAHGYLAQMGGSKVAVYSAGVETHGLNPGAVAIMKADGIDIAHHQSNHVEEYADMVMDYVITVCDHAKERCPIFPASVATSHENFPDPAKAQGSAEEIQMAFEKTRDLIKSYCHQWLKERHLLASEETA